jgi:hypothetical protein
VRVYYLTYYIYINLAGPEELLPPTEVSPLLTLTSDGTMLQELLQTLENGGTAAEVPGGRMFSDDTINAIMGEHFREMAADVIKDIREGKDPREIRVPATVASPALHQAVAAVQLQRQISSTGSMSLREVQLSMQQAAAAAQQQQQAAGMQQQQQQLPTMTLQPQLNVNTAPPPSTTTPSMMTLQPTLTDRQQQVLVQGQVVHNSDGTQSVVVDPNRAIQAIHTHQHPQHTIITSQPPPASTTPTTIHNVQVPVQQQQQVMVQVAGPNGSIQYVPVLESNDNLNTTGHNTCSESIRSYVGRNTAIDGCCCSSATSTAGVWSHHGPSHT